ncbi:copper transporter [Trueperella sp. LYQ141]|uniref:copper transporter n=1 Tax=Trueperella sp. LYQ141 TaxID=3391058 RepID=UPI003983B5C5
MVDFRYHLVSLISVFFALAIGVILGAGPLQNSIGNVLQGQVSDLRVNNEKLKATNAELQSVNEAHDRVFDELASELMNDVLKGRAVAIVVLPGVNDSVITAVSDRLSEAGATVTGKANVQESWTLARQTTFRSSFADQIKSYVTSAANVSDTNTILALALDQLARGGRNANETLAGLMTGTDSPMLSIDGLEAKSDAVVVLTASVKPNGSSLDADEKAQAEYDATTFTALSAELSNHGPTVIAGPMQNDGDIVRSLNESNADVSTVDTIESAIGAINCVLAVQAELNNSVVHVGFDGSAQDVIAPRPLVKAAPQPADKQPEPQPAPAPAPAPTAENPATSGS